jgi:DNA-binding response OmpR family regulator
MKHVLLVEHDSLLADAYRRALQGEYRVSLARDAQGAIDVMDSRGADLVITDTVLGANNGIEIIHEIRSYDDWMKVPVIILSSQPQSDFPVAEGSWLAYGIAAFAYKPRLRPSQLASLVADVLA